ncbi:DUF4942 domain-containing protein [Pseudomonas syringae]|uniref:DUF4942 domain-containing protein n=2 Tax=Pseudomonas syringae TaxID=317 RepID=UPI001F3B7EB2|nr:class I SAM-dependent methyltransferase [Pseudomonas syringae]MCF5382486.1 DUF4942 domain-containing protein [Pseudomonas syringae]MCF5419373.1 DUF4942 domain-containing protein [Pseudomonas syringae]MCF5451920.1 DUF4942 domain-containing protein [Pseudomonas syringae]
MSAHQPCLFTTLAPREVPSEFMGGCATEYAGGLAKFDMIDQLIGQFKQREQAIFEAKAYIQNALACGVMKYFINGAEMVYGNEYKCAIPTDYNAAIASLRVEYWNRLLNEAEIFDVMPAAKRKQARQQFQGLDCPPFDESTVRPTMEDLFHQRKKFFAERVDGIFQSLSSDHVTNQPWGFTKKLILAGVFSKDGYLNEGYASVISDLRGVVGRLSGRGEPCDYGTRQLLGRLQKYSLGKKTAIDGGAFYCTVYGVGTVHFEVASELAIELNSILAELYPTAIPSRFRTKTQKVRDSTYDLRAERLHMGIIDLLTCIERKSFGHSMHVYQRNEEDVSKTLKIIESIGGECRRQDSSTIYINFDFDPTEVLNQIIYTGIVPETVSYQFYPSRSEIAVKAASRLDIRDGLTYCEPQAGTGDLAQYLPKDSTFCIEIADVRVKVLAAKGYNVIKADFLKWALENPEAKVDRVLMNPPFSKGRALAHLTAAASMLKPNGRVVAILPASMISSAHLEGFEHDWSEVFEDQFEGTSVRVAILTATRKR